jgi:hypothetical protein
MENLDLQKEYPVEVSYVDAIKDVFENEGRTRVFNEIASSSDRDFTLCLGNRKFIAKVLPLKDSFEPKFRDASLSELICFLKQYPEFKTMRITALKTGKPYNFGDYYQSWSSCTDSNEWILGYGCFSCCFDEKVNEGFFRLIVS